MFPVIFRKKTAVPSDTFPASWGFHVRFILPTLFLVVLSMTISSAIHYVKARNALLASLSDRLTDRAETITQLLDEAVDTIQLNFMYWSGDATLTSVVQEAIGDVVMDAAHHLLRKIRMDYGYYEKLSAADANGRVIVSTDERETGTIIPERYPITRARIGQFSLSGVYRSPVTGVPVFAVSGPLYMDNRLVGTLNAVVKVAYFDQNYIQPVHMGKKGYAFLCGHDGLIIAHPEPGHVMEENVFQEFPEMQGRPGASVMRTSGPGPPSITVFRISRKTGWMVGLTAENDEFIAPVRQLFRGNLEALLLVGGPVIAILIWLSRIISRQLREIMELRVAKQGAEAASRSKSEFLASMSHEIRTPLNAILGFTEILEREVTERRWRGYLEATRISGKTLLRLINDILDLSKIEAGRLELSPKPVHVRSLCTEIRRMFDLETGRKGLSLNLSLAPHVPEYLVLDEIRLRQILVNLVGNAVKFTETGSVGLSLDGNPDGPWTWELVIRVTDTGIGIPDASLGVIFDAFTQVGGGTTRTHGGTGLGLTITRHLIGMMGGNIRVESRENQGTTFEIRLPGLALLARLPGTVEPELPEIDEFFFEKRLVLVVEDNEYNRSLLRALLNGVNLDVIEANDGAAGLELARIHQPALILMDIRMPVMDGVEAMKRLRDDPEIRGIPVIALTASATIEDRVRISDKDFDDVVIKPIQRRELLTALARYLKVRRPTVPETSHGEAPPSAPDLPLGVRSELEAMLPEWRNVMDRQFMPDIQRFGERVRELGTRQGLPVLATYGEELVGCIDGYDIEKMMTLLNEYPSLAGASGKKGLVS